MKPKLIPKKELLFLKSLNLLKFNSSKTGLMILFDAMFFIIFFYILPISNEYFAKTFAAPEKFASNSILVFFIIIITLLKLIYYLIVLLAYSFFKYCVLDYVKSLFDKTEFSFKRLSQFYSLNVIIAGIFFAVMLLFNFLLANIKQTYQPFVFIVLAVPYSLFLYIIINTSHSLFYQGASIKESIKKSFKITFTKIQVYRETILVMILAALLLWLLFLGSGYLIRLISSKNYSLYLNVYAYFKQASIIIFDLVFYAIILINRISFYAIARNK